MRDLERLYSKYGGYLYKKEMFKIEDLKIIKAYENILKSFSYFSFFFVYMPNLVIKPL